MARLGSASKPDWLQQFAMERDAVLARYNIERLAGIRSTLPRLAGQEQESNFIHILLSWADYYASQLILANPIVRAVDRDNLAKFARALQLAEKASVSLSGTVLYNLTRAKRQLTGEEFVGGLLDPDLPYIENKIRDIRELSKIANHATSSLAISRGVPKNHTLRQAILDLAWTFEYLTGLKAGRRVHALGDNEGKEYGPFSEFVARTIEPIWPDAGGAHGTLRSALALWNRIPQRDPYWWSIRPPL